MGIICNVNLLEEQGHKFIQINVQPYAVPVSLRGRYFYRSGSTKMELTGIELNEFLFKKAGKTWDDLTDERATINDIDEASLNKFIKDSLKYGRMPDVSGLSMLQILEKLNLVENGILKRAAIILFSKNPNKFYPSIQIRIGRFGQNSADLRFHEILEGNLIFLLQEVQAQLNYKFLTKRIEFEGMRRLEKDEYPVIAHREMLLNALVHRNYSGAHTQMHVYDDRITLWNDGKLPQDLCEADLLQPHSSKPRNPVIAHACFLAGYIDTWGSGTLKILEACKADGLPEPVIKEIQGGIQVTLFKFFAPTKSSTMEVTMEVTTEVTMEVEKLVSVMTGMHSSKELKQLLNLKNDEHFRKKYIKPALESELIQMTIPDKPNSNRQKYQLTEIGKNWVKKQSANSGNQQQTIL
jgi:ATP-dependent DNA helicase RecG